MLTHKCFSCDAQIADEPGNVYCGACVAKQIEAQGGTDREVFDAYNRAIDAMLRAPKP